MEECFCEAMSLLQEIINDQTISKNIKSTMNQVALILQEECDTPVKCDKAIQVLTIGEDPNIDMFTRTRIWSLLSMLESIS